MCFSSVIPRTPNVVSVRSTARSWNQLRETQKEISSWRMVMISRPPKRDTSQSFIGAYPSPEAAETAVRMHARYQGNIDDPDLFERAEIRSEDLMGEITNVLRILAETARKNTKPVPSFDDINLFKPAATPQVSAEDAKKEPEGSHRELPPELAQILASAPEDFIDFIMKAHDAGAIDKVTVFKMDTDHLN